MNKNSAMDLLHRLDRRSDLALRIGLVVLMVWLVILFG